MTIASEGSTMNKAQTVTGLPTLLTTTEVAELLRVDRSTLGRWRAGGIGPRVTWLSPNVPRYQSDDIAEWLRRVAA